jgi:hypothetical protein
MEDKDITIAAAIILAGILSGEGVTQDDRTLKRAIDLAYQLKVLLNDRALLPPKI